MRSTGQLFRWGLTCLFLVPVALVGSFVASGTPVLLWLALALILIGGAFNAAANESPSTTMLPPSGRTSRGSKS